MGMNALEVRRRVMLAQPHEAVATGAVASFRTDVVSPLPMEFDLVPIQAGTGDPSPDNVRPITGHDGFTRNLTGINVWDEQYEVGNYNSTTGEKQPANNQLRAKNPIPVVPNTTYYFKGMSNGRVLFYKADGTYISSALYNNTTFTTPANCWFVTFHLGTAYGTTYKDNVGINYPATDTDYHAYDGHSYSTTFPTPPETVYGGHVTDNGDGTGTLAVDKIGVDMSTLTWTGRKTGDINKLWSSTLPELYKPRYNTKVGWMCDKFTEGKPSDTAAITPDTADVGIYSYRSTGEQSNTIYMVIPKADTPDGFLVYEIIEPHTYILPMTALQSLIGQNHVWVDNADSVSVEYWGH